MRRIAEGYVELESAAFRDKTETGMKADEAKAKGGNVDGFRDKAEDAILKAAARRPRSSTTRALKDQYPKWCQTTTPPIRPRARAAATRCSTTSPTSTSRRSDLDNARKVYLELIQSWPQSKYIPNAYLAFGELFFNEAQGDPSKWDARGAVVHTRSSSTRRPTTRSGATRTTSSATSTGTRATSPARSPSSRRRSSTACSTRRSPTPQQLAVSARRDIIPIYALAGDPKRAYDFFQPLSGDSSGSTEKTFKLMDDLGQNYLDTGHYAEGIALYQDLMKRDRGPKFCVYQGHITEATLAMKSGNKDLIMTELKNQLDVHNTFVKQSAPADERSSSAPTSRPTCSPRRRWRGTSRRSAPAACAARATSKTMALAAAALRQRS